MGVQLLLILFQIGRRASRPQEESDDQIRVFQQCGWVRSSRTIVARAAGPWSSHDKRSLAISTFNFLMKVADRNNVADVAVIECERARG